MRGAYMKAANRYLCTSEASREEDMVTKIINEPHDGFLQFTVRVASRLGIEDEIRSCMEVQLVLVGPCLECGDYPVL